MRNDDPQAASRPFDKDRDGFVLSEGAGIVVLEELEHARRRGATIYAELLGCGSTADAHHITAPHPEGTAPPGPCSWPCATPGSTRRTSSTSTPTAPARRWATRPRPRPSSRSSATHARRLAISSTKSMLGHLLGASGGVELIATALTIKHGVVHPTINYQTPDPACDLDYVPNTAREMRVRRAISNSFGFGGHNCCAGRRRVMN